MTNSERTTGKRAVSKCIHLEKTINLMEQGNVPKPWLGGTQALSPPPLTGKEEEKWTREGVEAWDC